MEKVRLKIHIVYGSAWGYTQRYEDLKNVIQKRCHPGLNLQISGRKVSRKLAFEVYFNEVLVHSLINTKVMPHFEAVALKAQVFLASDQTEIQPIEETESCTCRFQSCCYVSW